MKTWLVRKGYGGVSGYIRRVGELKIAEKRRNVFIIDCPKDFLGG